VPGVDPRQPAHRTRDAGVLRLHRKASKPRHGRRATCRARPPAP